MKKILILCVLLAVMLMVPSIVGAAKYLGSDQNTMVGFDLPNFGWAQYENGLLKGYAGFNMGVGFSQKTYFHPGLTKGEFNNYWGWGTVAVIVPYFEVGSDIPFAVSDDGDFWTFGGSISLVLFVPTPRLSLAYHF